MIWCIDKDRNFIPELCAKKDKENVALQKQLEAAYKDAKTNLTMVKREFSTTVLELEKEKLTFVKSLQNHLFFK